MRRGEVIRKEREEEEYSGLERIEDIFQGNAQGQFPFCFLSPSLHTLTQWTLLVKNARTPPPAQVGAAKPYKAPPSEARLGLGFRI